MSFTAESPRSRIYRIRKLLARAKQDPDRHDIGFLQLVLKLVEQDFGKVSSPQRTSA